MRVLVQRVKNASVTIDGQLYNQINYGYLLFVGFKPDDTTKIVDEMVNKLLFLRVCEDENQKMNLSIQDIHGEILSISQFTLYADARKGRRPSFTDAARPEIAIPLYDYFNQKLAESNLVVKTGVFGSDMKIELLNDGPTTIWLDSNDICKA